MTDDEWATRRAPRFTSQLPSTLVTDAIHAAVLAFANRRGIRAGEAVRILMDAGLSALHDDWRRTGS